MMREPMHYKADDAEMLDWRDMARVFAWWIFWTAVAWGAVAAVMGWQ